MIGDIYIMSGINYYYTFPCNSHANAFMINSTGVLESTEEMKKTEILEKYGDVINTIELVKTATTTSVYQTKQ